MLPPAAMLIGCGVNAYPRAESQMFASIVPVNALAVGRLCHFFLAPLPQHTAYIII